MGIGSQVKGIRICKKRKKMEENLFDKIKVNKNLNRGGEGTD